MQAAETQVADLREVALGKALVHAPGAGLVHGPPAPLPALDDGAPLGPQQVPLVPQAADLGGPVRVGIVGVADDLIPGGLGLLDRLAQLRLAAQPRIDGEDLRVSPVVPADVPAHQAELGPVDPLLLELVDDPPEPLERDRDLHGRFVFGVLLRRGRGHRLPAHADPHHHGAGCIRQLAIVLDALLQRADDVSAKLEAPIRPGHVAVRRALAVQQVELDREVVVRGLAVEVEAGIHAVDPASQVDHLAGLVSQAGHDHGHRAARRADAERVHHLVRISIAARRTLLERAVHAVAEDVEALLPGPGGGDRVMHLDAARAGRDVALGHAQRLDAALRGQGDVPRLGPAVGKFEIELRLRLGAQRGRGIQAGDQQPPGDPVLHRVDSKQARGARSAPAPVAVTAHGGAAAPPRRRPRGRRRAHSRSRNREGTSCRGRSCRSSRSTGTAP